MKYRPDQEFETEDHIYTFLDIITRYQFCPDRKFFELRMGFWIKMTDVGCHEFQFTVSNLVHVVHPLS